MSALHAGLHIMPMAIIMAPGAVVSSRILARRGARLPMLASGLGMAAGGVLLSRLTIASPTWPIVLAFCVFGVGAGMVNPPITYAAVSGMPTTQAGVASSIASTSRQVGQSLGVAVTGLDPGREPARPVPGPVRPRQSRSLAAASRLRRRGLLARPGHHKPLGAGHSRPHRRQVRRRRAE